MPPPHAPLLNWEHWHHDTFAEGRERVSFLTEADGAVCFAHQAGARCLGRLKPSRSKEDRFLAVAAR